MQDIATELTNLDTGNIPEQAEPVVKPEPPCNLIESVKKLIHRSFILTSVMIFVVTIIMLSFSMFILDKHSVAAKKVTFSEISRSRGEVVQMVEKERNQIHLLQQSMMVYSDSIDSIVARVSTLEATVNAKAKVVVVPEPVKVQKQEIVTVTQTASTTSQVVVKKSFWSRMFSCGK